MEDQQNVQMTLKAVHKSQRFEKICEAGFVDILRQMRMLLQGVPMAPAGLIMSCARWTAEKLLRSTCDWRTYEEKFVRAGSISRSSTCVVGGMPLLGQITVFIDDTMSSLGSGSVGLGLFGLYTIISIGRSK